MELPNISKHSPHLANALKREGIPEMEWMDRAFSISLENGGWSELDFERDPEASYNPRPARVALILLRDAKIKDGKTLTAAVLATAHADLELLRTSATDLPTAVCELAILAQAEPEILESQSTEPAGLIAAALHLDRARHRHLTRDPEKLLKWEEFMQLTEKFASLADRVSPELSVLLTAWHRRANDGATKIK